MLRVLVVSCLLVLGAAARTNVAQCIRNEGELPLTASVRGCQVSPCLLPQNEDMVIDMVFKTPRLITKMRTLATAHLGIISIPYDLQENSVTCNFLTNTYCPILEDTVVHYILKLHISTIFPVGTSLPLEFHVVDRTTGMNVPMFCIRVPITITPPITGLLHSHRTVNGNGTTS